MVWGHPYTAFVPLPVSGNDQSYHSMSNHVLSDGVQSLRASKCAQASKCENMTDIMDPSVKEAATSLGYGELKPEQERVLTEFVKGKDVFVFLPTGYGKSQARSES